jgi:hypothetical protein
MQLFTVRRCATCINTLNYRQQLRVGLCMRLTEATWALEKAAFTALSLLLLPVQYINKTNALAIS